MPNDIMWLEEFKPHIEIESNSVTVEIKGNLFSTRKEADLMKFLEIAKNIVDTVVQQG
jgi:hypothetical protein